MSEEPPVSERPPGLSGGLWPPNRCSDRCQAIPAGRLALGTLLTRRRARRQCGTVTSGVPGRWVGTRVGRGTGTGVRGRWYPWVGTGTGPFGPPGLLGQLVNKGPSEARRASADLPWGGPDPPGEGQLEPLWGSGLPLGRQLVPTGPVLYTLLCRCS